MCTTVRDMLGIDLVVCFFRQLSVFVAFQTGVDKLNIRIKRCGVC